MAQKPDFNKHKVLKKKLYLDIFLKYEAAVSTGCCQEQLCSCYDESRSVKSKRCGAELQGHSRGIEQHQSLTVVLLEMRRWKKSIRNKKIHTK